MLASMRSGLRAMSSAAASHTFKINPAKYHCACGAALPPTVAASGASPPALARARPARLAAPRAPSSSL